MKKILALTTSILFIGTGLCFMEAAPSGDSGIEEIIINVENDSGSERGGSPVNVFLIHTTNSLHVTLDASVGVVTISIQDTLGGQVSTTVVDATRVHCTQIDAPVITGAYSIEIQSANYHGRGMFVI